jgi:hypothetical protein
VIFRVPRETQHELPPTGLLLGYVMIVRPWLKTLTPLAPAFAAEASFVQKLQARLTGWKT